MFKNIIAICSLLFVFASCEDQLELEPEQSLSSGEALGDIDGMLTALSGAYDLLQDLDYYGREYIVMPEIEANLMYLTIDNSNRFVQSYNYQFVVSNGDFTALWNEGYDGILRANNIINNIDAIDGDQALKDQIKGEALAIRALIHFDLVRFFGRQYTAGNPSSDLGVPIILEAAIEEPPRNTVEEVYNQVISDLNAAKGLVVDAGILKFSPDAVDALLARVALYRGDFSQADNLASSLINSGKYELSNDLFTMTSTGLTGFAPQGTPGEIFTLRMDPSEDRGSDNLGSIYNPQGYGDIRVATDLIDLYEDDDIRKSMIYMHDDGEMYHSKYFEQDGINGLSSPKLLRIAEMYLIRAESRLKNGDAAGAAEDLNAIRSVRGASMLSDVTMDDLLDERRRELALEGHTLFDYWRNSLDIVRQQCNTGIEVEGPCTIEASSFLAVHPIPQREMDVNQNMVQNPGY